MPYQGTVIRINKAIKSKTIFSLNTKYLRNLLMALSGLLAFLQGQGKQSDHSQKKRKMTMTMTMI